MHTKLSVHVSVVRKSRLHFAPFFLRGKRSVSSIRQQILQRGEFLKRNTLTQKKCELKLFPKRLQRLDSRTVSILSAFITVCYQKKLTLLILSPKFLEPIAFHTLRSCPEKFPQVALCTPPTVCTPTEYLRIERSVYPVSPPPPPQPCPHPLQTSLCFNLSSTHSRRSKLLHAFSSSTNSALFLPHCHTLHDSLFRSMQPSTPALPRDYADAPSFRSRVYVQLFSFFGLYVTTSSSFPPPLSLFSRQPSRNKTKHPHKTDIHKPTAVTISRTKVNRHPPSVRRPQPRPS